ncbi:MAG: hypothetical protein ACYCPT_04355 [Acidimicrobiales bacterium]
MNNPETSIRDVPDVASSSEQRDAMGTSDKLGAEHDVMGSGDESEDEGADDESTNDTYETENASTL